MNQKNRKITESVNPKAYLLKIKKKIHNTAVWKTGEDRTDKFEWQGENITIKTEIFENHGYSIHKLEKFR